MNNLNDLIKAVSDAVSGQGATPDPNTIPIEIEGIELAAYRVEYNPEDNVIVIYTA